MRWTRRALVLMLPVFVLAFGNSSAKAGPPTLIPVIGVVGISSTADIPKSGLTVTVKNFGGRDLTAAEVGTITIRLVVDGKIVGPEKPVPALRAGHSTNISFPPFALPAGNLKLGFDILSCHGGVGCQGHR